MEEFEDESDFFGLLQVGILRDNELQIEDLKKIIEKIIVNVFGVENIKIELIKTQILYENLNKIMKIL
jgi:hypothetical protein